jgi:hypothetical protein
MMPHPLSAERQRLFDEVIWRLMGKLDNDAWRDMLDPRSRLGAAVRALYLRLSEAPDDDEPTALLLASGASFAIPRPHRRRD